jgi:hypothetical protein
MQPPLILEGEGTLWFFESPDALTVFVDPMLVKASRYTRCWDSKARVLHIRYEPRAMGIDGPFVVSGGPMSLELITPEQTETERLRDALVAFLRNAGHGQALLGADVSTLLGAALAQTGFSGSGGSGSRKAQ